MYRGTTPTHTFRIPIDPHDIKDVKVNYSQNGKLVLCKRLCEKGRNSNCSFRVKWLEMALDNGYQWNGNGSINSL